MSAEQSKTMARRFFEEGFGRGDLALLDEIMAADAVDHTPLPGVAPGREGYKQTISMIRAAFPDMTMTVNEVLADGNSIVVRWTSRGTHRGDFMGVPATGKQFEIGGISIVTFAAAKISGDWTQWDGLGLMTQLGAIPAGATA